MGNCPAITGTRSRKSREGRRIKNDVQRAEGFAEVGVGYYWDRAFRREGLLQLDPRSATRVGSGFRHFEQLPGPVDTQGKHAEARRSIGEAGAHGLLRQDVQ